MLEKQRNGEGWEGGVPLFLDEQSHQFLQLESGSPYSYIANMPKADVLPGLEGEYVNIRESSAQMSVKRMASLIEYILDASPVGWNGIVTYWINTQ